MNILMWCCIVHHLIFVFLYPLCANVPLVHTILVYIKLNLTSEIYFIPFPNAVIVADVHSNAVILLVLVDLCLL